MTPSIHPPTHENSPDGFLRLSVREFHKKSFQTRNIRPNNKSLTLIGASAVKNLSLREKRGEARPHWQDLLLVC